MTPRLLAAAASLALLPGCAPAPDGEWRPTRESDDIAIQVALLEGVLEATELYTAARGIHTVCLAPARERGVRWDGSRLRPESSEAEAVTHRLLGLIRVPYRKVVPFYECHRQGVGGWEVTDAGGDPAVLVYTRRWEYETDRLVEATATVRRTRRDHLSFTCLLDRTGRRWKVGPCTCSSAMPGRCERIPPTS